MIRPVAAEALGTALLLATVVGSGVMGERLAGGNAAVALLANTIATGAGLFTLITIFAPISGGHFNPAVTLAAAVGRTLGAKEALAYIVAQFMGGGAGVLVAHAMFALPLLQTSAHARGTFGECLGEVVATFGLVLTIRLSARAPLPQLAAAVALWITAAYWFTSSTSFANPAVTLARAHKHVYGDRPQPCCRLYRSPARRRGLRRPCRQLATAARSPASRDVACLHGEE